MTVKSKAQLDAVFADSGATDITPEDIRDILESINVGFHIYCDGTEAAQTIGTSWVQVDQFNQQGLKRGWTFGTGIKAICSAGSQGIYRYDLAIGTSGSTAQFDVSLFKLPSTEIAESRTRIKGSAMAPMCGFTQISAGDEIALAIRKVTGSADITFTRGTSMVFLRVE